MNRYIALLLGLLCSAPSWAVDIAISALPSASALGGTEHVPILQSSQTRRATSAQLAAYVTAGIKHQRVTTGSIGLGASALVTLTWTAAFADSSYDVVCSVQDSTASILSLEMVHIESKTASAVGVRVKNTSLGALTGTLSCIAMHD